VTTDGRFQITHGGRVVCDAAIDVITSGISYRRERKERKRQLALPITAAKPDLRESLLALLGSVNISDKAPIFQHYDSEVQGRAVLRPGEADAAVEIFVPGANVALAASIGSHSRIGLIDPYAGGAWAVFEATRNAACVGALPLCITDCLNFGDPEDPGVFHEFVESVRGIGDACRALTLFGDNSPLPVISGNVSLYNQSEKGNAIAPTPIVACAARLEDASRARGFALKQVGSRLMLLGKLHEDLGGSEYERRFGNHGHEGAPQPDFTFERALVRALVDAFSKGLILAAHDVALGGLLVTVAEMAIASHPFEVGARLDLGSASAASCFSEMGGVVVEVGEGSREEFTAVLAGHRVPFLEIGRTVEAPALHVTTKVGSFTVTTDELRAAHTGRLAEILYG
jgi:phosphoribosylformylglycinamidine synthase